ncbi:MAG TPA: glycosyltransferase 87 family protein [Ktedonobacterales bacterium]
MQTVRSAEAECLSTPPVYHNRKGTALTLCRKAGRQRWNDVIEAHAADTRSNPMARSRWSIALPTGEVAARLTLLGVVIALHNLLELPRDPLSQAIGAPLTGLLAFLALAVSLALLLLALGEHAPRWRWLRSRRAQAIILALTLGAALIGVKQLGTMAIASFQPPFYPNDGATLDHYAAQQLLDGHNPYSATTIVAAVQFYHQKPEYTTPLHAGPFAGRALTDYPSASERAAAFARQSPTQPGAASGFEGKLSYPALAFLSLVPLVWAGLPTATPLTLLCALALAALLVTSAPRRLRPWVALLFLADVPLLNAALIADPDILYLVPLFAAWRWREHATLAAILLGLALSTKQLAWFSAPFLLMLIWRERSWRAAAGVLAGAVALFAAINAPFFVNSPRAWLAGVLAPQVDPMFPLGNGLIRLSLSGLLPLAPSLVYTALEALALVGALLWYWRNCLRAPALGYVLAMAPLFFAWRSLTTYFYFTALPALALWLAALRRHEAASAPLEQAVAP